MQTVQTQKPRILALVGATASGKTVLSLALAQSLGCEILCMDSMQIYRRMDIGTAKPTPAEQAAAPHHLLDIVEPTEAFSVAQYVEAAHDVIRGVLARGHIPLLVGGTGLYLRGLSLPMDYGGLPSDPALRAELQALLDREIYRLTGAPMSAHRVPDAADGPYDFQVFAIDWPRAELHRRINLRVDQMMADGLPAEVQSLLNSGATPEMQSMQGLGYKELAPVLLRGAPLANAVEQIKTGTRNYARRQLIWFRRDTRVRWIASEKLPEAKDIIIKIWEDPASWISNR